MSECWVQSAGDGSGNDSEAEGEDAARRLASEGAFRTQEQHVTGSEAEKSWASSGAEKIRVYKQII